MNKPCKYAVNNSGDCWEYLITLLIRIKTRKAEYMKRQNPLQKALRRKDNG